jgi:hypothetical protein
LQYASLPGSAYVHAEAGGVSQEAKQGGEAVSWTSEGGEAWTRNIPGIDGTLSATEKNGAEPVLQLHDLQGNVIATPAEAEGETKLLTTYNSSEFGVPVNGTPPSKYSWLGASGVAAELPSSGATSQGGDGYVPQLGAALQTQPTVFPGAAPSGSYITPYITTVSAGVIKGEQAWAAGAGEREAARVAAHEKAAHELLCMENPAACAAAPGPGEGGNGPGEETFGDPVHCYIGGTPMVGEEVLGVAGYGGCNQGLPQGTWLYVCAGAVNAFGKTGGCSHVTVKHHRSRHWSIGTSKAIQCEPGETLRALVEFYVPGGKVLYAGTENGGECGGGTDSIDEAALSLFGDPSNSSTLELLLSFFRE